MTIDHASRDQLYRSARQALGEEEADTLMASLPPVDWTDLARGSDMDARFTALDTRLDLRFEGLEHKLTATFESALRRQTQWVFGSVILLAITMLGTVISALTLA